MASEGNSAISPSQQPSEENRFVKEGENDTKAPIRDDFDEDDSVGKRFVGHVIKKCDGFRLIMVKMNDNKVLKGWIPDEDNLHPVTRKNDLPQEPPMVQPHKVQKRASAIQSQSPIPLKDLTFVLPTQMWRPFEEPTNVASSSEPVNLEGPISAVMVNQGFSEPIGDVPSRHDEPKM